MEVRRLRTRIAKENRARERRITDNVVVDCYTAEEQASGWNVYLGDTLGFPFRARCISARRGSPLRKGEVVTVTGMIDLDYCPCAMFVEVEWGGRELAVPLEQLKPIGAPKKTVDAVEDWRYWLGRGSLLS